MPIANKPALIQAQFGNSIAKSADEAALFPFFSTERTRLWLDSLNTMNQVISFSLKIILLIAFIFNAGLELARLITAKNRNFDRWLGMFMATSTAITGGTAIIGMLIWGATFALFGLSGPWLFMIALGASLVHQLVGVVSNLYRALMAPHDSQTRRNYLQAAALNLLNIVGLALTVAMVLAVMISPVGPAIAFGITIAAAAVALVAATWLLVSWIKPQWTERFKKFLGINKPQDENLLNNIVQSRKQSQQEAENEALIAPKSVAESEDANTFIEKSLFKRDYHKETVYRLLKDNHSSDNAYAYLDHAISNKIEKLLARTPEISKTVIFNLDDYENLYNYKDKILATTAPDSLSKNSQKVFALLELYDLLDSHKENPEQEDFSKSLAAIVNKYPKISQSFFADVGDTQDLVDAVQFLLKSKTHLQTKTLASESVDLDPAEDYATTHFSNSGPSFSSMEI